MLPLFVFVFANFPLANAAIICGQNVSGKELKHALGNMEINAMALDDRKPVACQERNRYYLILPPPERTVIYIENPIVPFEIFTGSPIGKHSRFNYIRRMNERAYLTVNAALQSGLINDQKVLGELREMTQGIFRRYFAIHTSNEIDTSFCLSSGPMAYVETKTWPLRAHLCRKGYDSESPHTLIHEFVHILQLQRNFRNVTLEEECEADLVAMMATRAAAHAQVIKREWDIRGSYFARRKCYDAEARFRSFSSSLYRSAKY